MFEDLLPYTRVSTEEAVALVTQVIEEQNGCSMDREAVVDLVEKQIRLDGAFTLHSENAAKNGGDFDFDLVAVVEGDFFFQAEDGIRDHCVTGVQTCALPI